jgi:hypothetical protein
MVLRSTQLLSITNLFEGKGRPVRRADNLTAICEPIVREKMWKPRCLTTLWASTACYRDSFINRRIITVVEIDFVCQCQPTTSLHWRILLPLATPSEKE